VFQAVRIRYETPERGFIAAKVFAFRHFSNDLFRPSAGNPTGLGSIVLNKRAGRSQPRQEVDGTILGIPNVSCLQ
jgi:hypothetical protein